MTDDQLVARALRGSRGGTRIPAGQAMALYKRWRDTGQLRRYLVVEYRCAAPAGCVLARVFTTPAGTIIYKPASHITTPQPPTHPPGPDQPALQHHAHRRPQHRPESAYLMPSFPITVSLGCDHVQTRYTAATVHADIALAHRRGSPTGRRIPGPTADDTERGNRTRERTRQIVEGKT